MMFPLDRCKNGSNFSGRLPTSLATSCYSQSDGMENNYSYYYYTTISTCCLFFLIYQVPIIFERTFLCRWGTHDCVYSRFKSRKMYRQVACDVHPIYIDLDLSFNVYIQRFVRLSKVDRMETGKKEQEKTEKPTPIPDLTCSFSMHPDIFEIVRSAVFLGKVTFALKELSRFTPFALWRIGTIEVGNMSIPNIPEPTHTCQRSISEKKKKKTGLFTGPKKHTSEPWLHLQTIPKRLNGPEHPPISRKRSLHSDPGN